jgi:hypothetical protein
MAIRGNQYWERVHEMWGEAHQRASFADRDTHATKIAMLKIAESSMNDL